MGYTTKLDNISERDAVADALQRCIIGIDDHQPEMIESAFVQDEDSSFTIDTTVVKGWDVIKNYLTDKILPLHTTHFITNVRVDLEEGSKTARMSANALAYHLTPAEAFKEDGKAFVTAGLYLIDLIKDPADELWKINQWTLKLKWTSGDRSIIG